MILWPSHIPSPHSVSGIASGFKEKQQASKFPSEPDYVNQNREPPICPAILDNFCLLVGEWQHPRYTLERVGSVLLVRISVAVLKLHDQRRLMEESLFGLMALTPEG